MKTPVFPGMNILWWYWEICPCLKSPSDETILTELYSNQRKLQSHFSLIMGRFARTSFYWEAISSAFQSDQRRIRAHTSLIRGWFSSRQYCDQWMFLSAVYEHTSFDCIKVQSEENSVWVGLIRGSFCLGRSDQWPFRSGRQPGRASWGSFILFLFDPRLLTEMPTKKHRSFSNKIILDR